MAHYQEQSNKHKDDLRSGMIPYIKSQIKKLQEETTALTEERRRRSQGPKTPRPLEPPGPTASAPARGKTCVEFVGVSRQGRSGWNLAESVHVEGDPHWMHKQYKSPRGWDGDVKVTWTKPPERICEGDSFTIRMEASNFKLHPQDPKAAAVYMNFDIEPTRMLLEKRVCSNPLPWDPKSGVHLTNSESRESDECTFKVRSITGPRDTPECRLRAYLEAGPWYGTVCYNYKVIKE
ncbi:MAG: hypothetical protein OEW45_14590 [Deltaproteobacteria bacterium]|nr:hypothetical protein [Deltaproteobacteria bacterium]